MSDLELHNVGTIYVAVGGDSLGYHAQTVHDLRAARVDAEITVRIDDLELIDDDDPSGVGELEPGSVQMWRVLLLRMRDALARFMLLGKMSPGVYGSFVATEEERGNLDAAIRQLEEEGAFAITPQVALRTLYGEAAEDEQFREGVQMLSDVMRSTMKPGEDNITIGEALERLEEKEEDE